MVLAAFNLMTLKKYLRPPKKDLRNITKGWRQTQVIIFQQNHFQNTKKSYWFNCNFFKIESSHRNVNYNYKKLAILSALNKIIKNTQMNHYLYVSVLYYLIIYGVILKPSRVYFKSYRQKH